MKEDFSGIVLNQVTVIVDGDTVGFSMNLVKEDKFVVFKTKDVPIQLLEIISQRLSEDITTCLQGTESMIKTESQFNQNVELAKEIK